MYSFYLSRCYHNETLYDVTVLSQTCRKLKTVPELFSFRHYIISQPTYIFKYAENIALSVSFPWLHPHGDSDMGWGGGIIRHHNKQVTLWSTYIPSDLSQWPLCQEWACLSFHKRFWLGFSFGFYGHLLHSQAFEQMFPPMIRHFPVPDPEKWFTSNVEPSTPICITSFFPALFTAVTFREYKDHTDYLWLGWVNQYFTAEVFIRWPLTIWQNKSKLDDEVTAEKRLTIA